MPFSRVLDLFPKKDLSMPDTLRCEFNFVSDLGERVVSLVREIRLF